MEYTEHRLRVARTARWGSLGPLTFETREVWFALHGYAQLAAGLAHGARWPVSSLRAFVFPEALQRFYAADPANPPANRSARVVGSWMTREARLDDIADNHAYLDALWDHVRTLAPDAVLAVLGFSQGGATAARWSAARAANGVPPARLVLWASTFPDDVDLGNGSPLRQVPVTIAAGRRDRWATPKVLEADRARLAAAGISVELHPFDGGHRLDDELLAKISELPGTPLRVSL
jgi:predicted esterase